LGTRCSNLISLVERRWSVRRGNHCGNLTCIKAVRGFRGLPLVLRMTGECSLCGKRSRLIARSLGLCVECIRDDSEGSRPFIARSQADARAVFGLPAEPPRGKKGIPCNVCSHECRIGDGEVGYCGLRRNLDGKLVSRVSAENALLHAYLDPQVTNCCSAWFCPAGTGAGYPDYAYRNGPEHGYYNLALFFYGCNFNCLFCQNTSHKELELAEQTTADQLVATTTANDRISCWCFFGGSPEPQLPFAVNSSRKMLQALPDGRILRVCFEWNGCGNPHLVERAAEIALKSGGNLKFDLKCFNPSLSLALSGVENSRSYTNFKMVYDKFYSENSDLPVLTATTLMVPGYTDAEEVEAIATFIASIDESIPYSLLVFFPHFMMSDLPITPVQQVRECYRAAKQHLKRVNVGNLNLLKSNPEDRIRMKLRA
jgi:pyruvate formate lyase activating enzyme